MNDSEYMRRVRAIEGRLYRIAQAILWRDADCADAYSRASEDGATIWMLTDGEQSFDSGVTVAELTETADDLVIEPYGALGNFATFALEADGRADLAAFLERSPDPLRAAVEECADGWVLRSALERKGWEADGADLDLKRMRITVGEDGSIPGLRLTYGDGPYVLVDYYAEEDFYAKRDGYRMEANAVESLTDDPYEANGVG